jgi:hypothetical protein
MECDGFFKKMWFEQLEIVHIEHIVDVDMGKQV